MRVIVDIEELEIEGDYAQVPGLVVTCDRCGHSVEVFGQTDASARAAAAKLRDECPMGESNYYDAEKAFYRGLSEDL